MTNRDESSGFMHVCDYLDEMCVVCGRQKDFPRSGSGTVPEWLQPKPGDRIYPANRPEREHWILGDAMTKRDDMPTVPLVKGRRYLRRDGGTFEQIEDGVTFEPIEGPDCTGDFKGSDGWWREANGSTGEYSQRMADAIADLGPIEAEAPADPYAALEWRTVNGEQVAIAALWGERPDWLRDDDRVSIAWDYPAHRVDDIELSHWNRYPAVILRRRPETVVLPTRYRLGADGQVLRCTCGRAEIVEGEE